MDLSVGTPVLPLPGGPKNKESSRRPTQVAVALSLAELRDTLLPRLISGKLRILEAEKLVEAVL